MYGRRKKEGTRWLKEDKRGIFGCRERKKRQRTKKTIQERKNKKKKCMHTIS
jgi:hypothetical protein